MGKKKETTPTAAVDTITLSPEVQVMLGSAPPEVEVHEGSLVTVGAEVRQVAHCPALNLRVEPSRDAEVLAILPEGTTVVVDCTQWVADGAAVWMAADALDMSGWVNAAFLAHVEGE